MRDHQDEFRDYQLRSNRLSCIISLPQDFLFRSGQADIQPKAHQPLIAFFQVVKSLPEHQHDLVIVEGHTDNVPIHNQRYPSNWELSSARSTSIAHFLTRYLDFPLDRISISAYADARPKIPYVDYLNRPLKGEELVKARLINRRVEIILTTPPKSLDEINLLFDGTVDAK
ncbi:OmpA family protein [Deltaproteobacteria bacterium TL4]